MSQAEETIILKLNDIIQLIAPDNPAINNNVYMVVYLDSHVMKLLLDGGDGELVINIQEDGELDNKDITEVILLDRNDVGYALEHDLVPGSWVNIFIGGDLPFTITGEITNIEEDMIEVTSYPQKEAMYIDFDYKGLPEDLHIESIQIREKPLGIQSQDRTSGELEEGDISEEYAYLPPMPSVDTVIREVELEPMDIVYGDTLEEIEQIVDLPESQQRYGIETQSNDLLDDLLSTIPTAQRTPKVLNGLHLLVQRFTELRSEFSEFDIYGNAKEPVVRGDDYSPLIKALLNHEKEMSWILPVVKMKKKIYDVKDVTDEDYDDIVTSSLAESYVDMNQIIEQYKDNVIPGSANSTMYLYNTLNPFLIPYVNNMSTPHISAEPVMVSCTGLSNNETGYLTSVRKGGTDGVISSFRLFQQRYTTGLQRLVSGAKKNELPTVGSLTPSDTMLVASYLTLPESALEFSRIQLPCTNILTKSNMGSHYLQLWRIMNKRTHIRPVVITNSSAKIDYNGIGFSKNILHYVADTMEPLTGEEYLRAVVPSSSEAFDIAKETYHSGLSFAGAVHSLEPYLIYKQDVTYGLYNTMNAFVRKKQLAYYKSLHDNKRVFERLQRFYIKSEREFTTIESPLMQVFDGIDEMRDRVGGLYSILSRRLTSSEILRIILYKDGSRLYGAATSLVNAGTSTYVQGLDKLIKHQLKESRAQIDAVDAQDKCKKYKLSKKYATIEDVRKDDDKPIFYDKEYDTTDYAFMKPYESKIPDMDNADWFILVVKELMASKSIPARLATKEVKRMLDGAQKVEQGDYAVLSNKELDEQKSYWKRVNHKWIKDKAISSHAAVDESKLFCNVQDDCIQVTGACSNMNTAKFELKRQVLKNILNEFDTYQAIASENSEALLAASYEYEMSNIKRLTKLNTLLAFQYNDEQIMIGEKLEKLDQVLSPYAGLRDRILGEDDFAMRQYDISRFTNMYTRSPEEGESPTWLYCIKTNTKLLPTFLKTLATVYMEGGDYSATLKELSSSGQAYVEGASVVDKASGYTIMSLAFSSEEGYETSGYKMQSRSELEKDLGEALMGDDEGEMMIGPDTEIIMNIITTLSKYIGVSLVDQRQFIVNHTTDIVSRSLESEEEYKVLVERQKKRGKKMPDYTFKKNNLILMVTCSFVFVSLQLMIPPAKTGKTFPNCRKSFSGYPLSKSTDNIDGLIYVACIMSKLEKSVEPWDTIKRTTEEKIVVKLKGILDNFIINDPEVMDMYEGKRKYIHENKDDDIPLEIDIEKWYTFLPPLKEIVLKTVQPLPKQFLDSLIGNVRKGNWDQMQQMNICMGKIIRFSIFVMKLIQNIIEKAHPILMNMNREPFIDNVCCNEKYVGVMEYLTSKDASIMKINETISVLTNYVFTIQSMQQAKYLFDPTDTRQHYQIPPMAFSESVIYQAFIVYCKYNKDVPLLNEQLLSLCENNVSEFENTDDLDTRVKTMKSEGKIYSEIALNQLMAIINRENIIHDNISHTQIGLNAQFRAVLEGIRDDSKPTVPMSIVEGLFVELDTFQLASSEESDEARKIKDILHELNDSYTEEIRTFMTKHGRLSLQKRKIMNKFFNSLDKWSYSTSEILSPEETEVFRLTNFLQTFIENITVIYPETILHKVGYTESTRHSKTWDKEISVSLLPRTMKVSYLHELDIKKFIKSYYADLQNIYASKNDVILTEVLNKAMVQTAAIQAMSKYTPRFTPFKTNTGVMRHPIDMDMVTQLYKFYVLAILRKHIHIAKEIEPVLRTPAQPTQDATEAAIEGMAELNSSQVI